ncbi:MAG: chromosome segregation protein SMC [Nocardioidaceae bacterium]
MHLKSLTLRGFKSFASSTTLHLEEGITCIVGPNGSGKSNVVDALAWVMGEQGAKSLRGGKMEDVIFAGTSGRPPLGRAEVLLTIDNADGALPIDYTEVTISRTMFRNGGSDYAINGQTCRLLDVQELLSDSGIGREMHVIVGQGQLDAILRATPEERRGFVEEAAGVLKHRKRKEKAVRKLDATEGNLVRLGDLLSEIRRQLKPLGRQAEVARRASVVQMEVRDARARLLADDLVSMRSAMEQELADEEALRSRRSQAEADLAEARATESALEDALRSDAPQLARAQETWFRLTALGERFRGMSSLAAERLRNVSEDDSEEQFGRAPEELEREAAHVRAQEQQIKAEVQGLQTHLRLAVESRHRAEAAHALEDNRLAGSLRAAADRREGLARLSGQVGSARSRVASAADEIGRLRSARVEAMTRADRAQRDFIALETRVAGLDAGEHGLDAEHEGAAALLTDIDDRLAKQLDEAQCAERERAALSARKEALELALAHRDGVSALLSTSDPIAGLLGSVAALLSVRHGYETAVAAALGSVADAAAVDTMTTAVDAIGHLKTANLGRAGLVVVASDEDASSGDTDFEEKWPALGSTATYAIDLVDAPPMLLPALRRLLHKTAVVDDLHSAQALVARLPGVVGVTRDGDVLGSHLAAGGSTSQPSLIEVQAAVDEAVASLQQATASAERLRFELSRLEAERVETQGRVDVALAKLHESDATLAAVAEELSQFGSISRSARSEADRIGEAIAAAEVAWNKDVAAVAELEQRLAVAKDVPDAAAEPETAESERLRDVARSARQTEMESRLSLRTAEERARALSGRADSLARTARHQREVRARVLSRRERRQREARAATAVNQGVQQVLVRLERSLQEALVRRTEAAAVLSGREHDLSVTRHQVRQLEIGLATLKDTVHRDEMLQAEHRIRLEQLEQRSLEELGLDLEALVTDYGPHQMVPPLPARADEEPEITPDCTPYVREEQQRRLRSAERALAELGRINPWLSRSSRHSRNDTSFSPSSSKTSARRGMTCSTSSKRSTSGWNRYSPRRTPTLPESSTMSSVDSFPAAKANSC